MLIGYLEGKRIAASNATRDKDYRCPECRAELILKKGRKIIHHFAHRTPTNCSWAKGETIQHLAAKASFYAALSARGLNVELEAIIGVLGGSRRADVLVHSPTGPPVVIELQHTAIPLDVLEARAKDYAANGYGQVWVPFIRSFTDSVSQKRPDGSIFIEKYNAKPFERWIHGFHMRSGMWMYDPLKDKLWHARLRKCLLWVPNSDYHDEYGEEHTSGGYCRESKRWKSLELSGPHDIGNLRIARGDRPATSLATYTWPKAVLANFVPTAE